ncbi:MAG TPA: pyruvate dehydrogenase (acetyl-transferring) E1 component subunit alpha [Myxococcales bacterium LLY-WYZ-16_1]|nr:pyruvate dehydrogenase (acetyl-transferring) E1 component subunit alpha [Myxococcales bacterium LLY-WYZ-16_1]
MSATVLPEMELTQARAEALLRQMLRIRRFEEKCAELYSATKIRGFLHLYIGQEAIAAGVIGALGPEDAIVATYREHGHALVRGIPARTVMAEMYGKRTGCSRGRGGSMHLFDAERRFFGGHAIVGGGLPLASGLALADRLKGRKAVTACFFGEGAAAEGEFHETLNLSALWKLPVLFLCENNLYGMGTALDRATSEPNIHRHAAAYRIPAQTVDGMDILAVEAATRKARAHIESQGGPYFLELSTYRFRAHSMFDPELYRDRSEVESWKAKGPIVRFKSLISESGLLGESVVRRLDAEVCAEIEDAVIYAESSEWEPADEMLADVYRKGGDSP